jgi:hypothetical protein
VAYCTRPCRFSPNPTSCRPRNSILLELPLAWSHPFTYMIKYMPCCVGRIAVLSLMVVLCSPLPPPCLPLALPCLALPRLASPPPCLAGRPRSLIGQSVACTLKKKPDFVAKRVTHLKIQVFTHFPDVPAIVGSYVSRIYSVKYIASAKDAHFIPGKRERPTRLSQFCWRFIPIRRSANISAA